MLKKQAARNLWALPGGGKLALATVGLALAHAAKLSELCDLAACHREGKGLRPPHLNRLIAR